MHVDDMPQDDQCSSSSPFREASKNTLSEIAGEQNDYHYKLGMFVAVIPDPADGDQYPIRVGKVLRVGRNGKGTVSCLDVQLLQADQTADRTDGFLMSKF